MDNESLARMQLRLLEISIDLNTVKPNYNGTYLGNQPNIIPPSLDKILATYKILKQEIL